MLAIKSTSLEGRPLQDSIISWTNKTWNPTHGCHKVSDGCRFCYAESLSNRYGHTPKPWVKKNAGVNVLLKPHKLKEPLGIDPGLMVFTNSMSDLFHRNIPNDYIAAVFGVMGSRQDLIFQTLTKRHARMVEWFDWLGAKADPAGYCAAMARGIITGRMRDLVEPAPSWPLPNLWLGVSVENGDWLNRIDALRSAPASVRFISAEPLIGPWGDDINLSDVDWLIVGGETGKGHRKLDHAWARQIRDACVEQSTAFFFKQDSGHRTELRCHLIEEDGTANVWNQWPNNLNSPTPADLLMSS